MLYKLYYYYYYILTGRNQNADCALYKNLTLQYCIIGIAVVEIPETGGIGFSRVFIP